MREEEQTDHSIPEDNWIWNMLCSVCCRNKLVNSNCDDDNIYIKWDKRNILAKIRCLRFHNNSAVVNLFITFIIKCLLTSVLNCQSWWWKLAFQSPFHYLTHENLNYPCPWLHVLFVNTPLACRFIMQYTFLNSFSLKSLHVGFNRRII